MPATLQMAFRRCAWFLWVPPEGKSEDAAGRIVPARGCGDPWMGTQREGLCVLRTPRDSVTKLPGERIDFRPRPASGLMRGPQRSEQSSQTISIASDKPQH